MKNLFNLTAVIVNAFAAATKAAADTLRKEGGVIVNVVKDIREGFEQSDLPKALANLKEVDMAASADEPTWLPQADEEIEKFLQTFGPYFKKDKKDEEGEDEETN